MQDAGRILAVVKIPTWVTSLALLGCSSEAPPGPSTSAPPASTSVAPSPVASAVGSASSSPAAPKAAPARPLYYEQALTDADLKGRTLRELSLMRNTIYARAGNTFRRPWLNAYFRGQPWYSPKETMDTSRISEIDKANARRIGDYDASLPKEALEAARDEIVARKKAGQATPDDAVELSLLSQRLGVYVGGEGVGADPSPLEDPSRLDALLRVEELSALSRRDLRILRNTIYARRGRDFDSKVVRSYFSGAAWYKPRADFHEGLLTEIDRKNVTMIAGVEDSLGGPLHENPDYVKRKDDWFSGA